MNNERPVFLILRDDELMGEVQSIKDMRRVPAHFILKEKPIPEYKGLGSFGQERIGEEGVWHHYIRIRGEDIPSRKVIFKHGVEVRPKNY